MSTSTERSDLQRRIGEWIATIRRDSGGISLRELSRRTGIPVATITTAARGEAGVALVVAIRHLAKAWPAGDFDSAVRFLFDEEPEPAAPTAPSRRTLDGDAEVAVNAALDQLRAVMGALEGLTERVSETSKNLEAVGRRIKGDPPTEDQLIALELENEALKLQLGIQLESQQVKVTEDGIRSQLEELKKSHQRVNARSRRADDPSPGVE